MTETLVATAVLAAIVGVGVFIGYRTKRSMQRCGGCRHPRYDHARKHDECWRLDCQCKGMRER